MKRKSALMAIALVLVMLFAQCAFAANGGLEITGTVPSDKETGKQPSNVAVKIIFNEDVSKESNDAANAKLITITNPEGEIQSFVLKHHDKYPNEIWCILEKNLVANTEYTVKVSAGIAAANGDTLSSDYVFTFKTRDVKRDNSISSILMLAMMGAMMFMTSSSMKKANAENGGKQPSKSNGEKMTSDPYRLAKERGITVDEAKALIAKEKEKADKKNAASAKARAKYEAELAAREAEIQRRVQEAHDASVYKVKTKGSMVAHGKDLPKAIVKKLNAKNRKKKK